MDTGSVFYPFDLLDGTLYRGNGRALPVFGDHTIPEILYCSQRNKHILHVNNSGARTIRQLELCSYGKNGDSHSRCLLYSKLLMSVSREEKKFGSAKSSDSEGALLANVNAIIHEQPILGGKQVKIGAIQSIQPSPPPKE